MMHDIITGIYITRYAYDYATFIPTWATLPLRAERYFIDLYFYYDANVILLRPYFFFDGLVSRVILRLEKKFIIRYKFLLLQ